MLPGKPGSVAEQSPLGDPPKADASRAGSHVVEKRLRSLVSSTEKESAKLTMTDAIQRALV